MRPRWRAGLKIGETAGVPMHAYSPSDLLHGPIATVSADSHALCLATHGAVADDVAEAMVALRQREATVVAVADAPDLLREADLRLPVPPGAPEPLATVGHTVRAQQLALELALLRGVDPDEPFSLTKVTPTD